MLVPDGTSVISPRSFSYVIGSFLVITSALLISEILRGNSGVPEGTEAGDPFQKADFKTMAQVVAAISANVILLDLLGFIVAATVSFWGVAYAFGARKYLKDFMVAIVFSVIVYFGFTQGLNINLPFFCLMCLYNSLFPFLTPSNPPKPSRCAFPILVIIP